MPRVPELPMSESPNVARTCNNTVSRISRENLALIAGLQRLRIVDGLGRVAQFDVREFVERGLRGHLRHGIDGDLAALRVSLTIPVQHLERDLFNVQRAQGPCAIPSRNAG